MIIFLVENIECEYENYLVSNIMAPCLWLSKERLPSMKLLEFCDKFIYVVVMVNDIVIKERFECSLMQRVCHQLP